MNMNTLMRRLYKPQAQALTTRGNYHTFFYPHSHMGVNNAFNRAPVKNIEPKRDFTEGEEAPLAHQQVREFPDWCKPYLFNYSSEGYLALFLGIFALMGWTYNRDICEAKGRFKRRVFKSQQQTNVERYYGNRLAVERIAAGDESFAKFLKPKERAHVHHH